MVIENYDKASYVGGDGEKKFSLGVLAV